MAMPRLAVIVAAAENGVIGAANDLPWYLPEDLRYFKRVTMGKPIVMGRKTFESIGRALPGRANIVITANRDYRPEGVIVVASIEAALVQAESAAVAAGVDEVLVIGGAQIYQQALDRADRLYLTRVHATVEGDAYLPEISWENWVEHSREWHAAIGENSYDYSFIVYDRTSR